MREPEWDDLPERAELQGSLERLQRRDWELWSIALLLLSVFAGGAIAYFFAQSHEEGWVGTLGLRYVWLVLFALVALVVLLNAYLIDRKRSLAALWRRYMQQSLELDRTRRQSALDSLTQVYNRRYFDEVVRVEALRCERSQQPLSFMLLDLVDFERINQTHGHFVGDHLLQIVARIMQETMRSSDQIFRYAGDDFIVLLPDTPPEGAACAQQRLLEHLTGSKDILEKIHEPLRVAVTHACYDGGKKLETVMDEMEANSSRQASHQRLNSQ